MLIDVLFAILGITLLKNIFLKNPKNLNLPFSICTIAIATLLFFYITSATAIANVWLNSHKLTPLIYKIAGLWGNHEGSMLLFFTCLTAWSVLLLRKKDSIRIASFILLLIGSYLYFKANPFVILAIETITGQDLNPALQNPYLAIHPPILYMGQSLCFVLWIWACVEPDNPKIQAYTRVCFGLITLGLILGSRWAYGELGWGGFWFWDPVETVSLFPWLAIIAAVHAKESSRICLLFCFPMVMLGLTLVRSGVLVSVHSFGFDLHSGIWLGICTILVWATTFIVFFKCKMVKTSMITLGFLSCLGVLVTLILLPILLKYGFGINILIDELFFHQYITPLAICLLIFAGLSPYLKLRNHGWSLFCTILTTSVWCWLMQPHFNMYATFSAVVGFWLIFSTINHIKHFFNKGFVSAHIGIGICILGASFSENFTQKIEVNLAELPVKIGNYVVNFESLKIDETPQVSKEILHFTVNSLNIAPQRQHFHTSKTIKHQPAWVRINFDHIHATAFASQDNLWKVELTLKPLISLFWVGLLLVIIGIFVSTVTYFKKYYQLELLKSSNFAKVQAVV